jgi:hypothetical protein
MNTDNFQGIQVGEELYDFVPDEHRIAAEYIHKMWKAAGFPRRLETEGAWKVMDGVFQIWGALFPQELLDFKQDLQEDQSAERSVSEANSRDGGYIPISYPPRLFQMMKVYFSEEKLQDRDLIVKLVHRYPLLKRTKFSIG